jgi:Double zinc ribbon
MENFRKLNNGVLEIQNLKERTEALNTHKKSALEELGTVVYTDISHISQGISEEKKVKEICDLLKGIDVQIKENEVASLIISDKLKESVLGLKPIPPCDCGSELYEGFKFCHQCGKKIDKSVKGEVEGEEKVEKVEKKSDTDLVCAECGEELPKDLPFCPHCGTYTEVSDN